MKEGERRNNVIYFREETASELAPGASVPVRRTQQNQQQGQQQRAKAEGAGLGMLGLVLAILAFFMMPLLMGVAGFIIGLVAVSRGATGTGRWAVGLSAAAVLLTLILRPFY